MAQPGSGLLGHTGSRRGRVAGVAAAALVVVVVAAAVVVSTRNGDRPGSSPVPSTASGRSSSQSPSVGPSTSAESGLRWDWLPVEQPAPGAFARVPSGYLGECVPNGRPAVCTSNDALSWSLQPDPSIFGVAGSARFNGWSIASGPGGWAAVGTVDPGTWRSDDGVNWTAVKVSLPGLQRARVQSLGSGFVMVAETYDGKNAATRVMTSTDGAVWTQQVVPAGVTGVRLAGAIGLVAQMAVPGEEDTGITSPVASSDGWRWSPITLPSGIRSVSSVIQLESGGYLSLGTESDHVPGALLFSSDGVTWQTSKGLSYVVDSLASNGQRLMAVSRIPGTDTMALWDSTDGIAWSRISLLDGKPLSATEVQAVDDHFVLFDKGRPTMVGTLTRRPSQHLPHPRPCQPRPCRPGQCPRLARLWSGAGNGISWTSCPRISSPFL